MPRHFEDLESRLIRLSRRISRICRRVIRLLKSRLRSREQSDLFEYKELTSLHDELTRLDKALTCFHKE